MSPRRRALLARLGMLAVPLVPREANAAGAGRSASAAAADVAEDDAAGGAVRRGRRLVFPRDHGAHVASRTEWWYATGWLGSESRPTHGFQVTFFRSRTGLAAGNPSRFAARQLLFAHAAVTDLAGRRHLHAQRIARWNGTDQTALDRAGTTDGDVRIGRWRFTRSSAGWQAWLEGGGPFELQATLVPTQPPLLQGDGGFSRKGPRESQASHYYSEPQLAARVELALRPSASTAPPAAPVAAQGRAWLDHEWSNEILDAEAVGWDWIGMNLFDGSALTAFRLRRADGTALWAGGSWRAPGAAPRDFAPNEVAFAPGARRWSSPATGAAYPMEWLVTTPAGSFRVKALLDEQELDSRGGTGAVYWEGLSELLDVAGRRVGLGYLELTGYAARLRL